ncbi:MAG: hypothetical protein VX343_04085 [Thermodesulfobacteriota bacterium]|nr:hypothetical protein [Thermodesulfobacteriota bacterium]
MAINFENVSSLSVTQKNLKFETDFTFKKIKLIEVTGILLDLNNDEGVKNIFNEATDIIEVYENTRQSGYGTINKGVQEILINGISYGEGYIDSFSVSGDQIRTAEYSASLEVCEQGDLSEIILSQNESQKINLGQSSLVDEDLKYLDLLDENFSFNISEENGVELNHSINCSFSYRESLISNKKNIWTGSSVQPSKLVNLKNKGKGSIKVSANSSASYQISLDQDDYVLKFDYLGQNSLSPGSASVQFGSKQIDLGGQYGNKQIDFTNPSSSNVTITLNANASNDTFFNNFKLYKKSETPIEKSRELANFLLNSSPNYSILESDYQNKYKSQSTFDNFSKTETFDELNLDYQLAKSISHNELQASDEYSLKQQRSIQYGNDGLVSVTESSEIKILKNKTDQNLLDKTNDIQDGSYNRCLQHFADYKDMFEYGCETNTQTKTPIDENSLYNKPINISKNFNFYAGTSNLEISFSNDETYSSNNGEYSNQSTETVENLDGYYKINTSGSIQGNGDTVSEKNQNAKTGYDNVISSIQSKINQTKLEYAPLDDFYISSKNVNTDEFIGAISYAIEFTNKKSFQKYSSGNKDIVKRYEIKVDTSNNVEIINQFYINCIPVAQKMNNMLSSKTIAVQIELEGFQSSTQIELFDAAKEILRQKNLLLGEDSEDENAENVRNSTSNEYVTAENFQFSARDKVLSYTRNIIDLSVCSTPTRTEGYFHFGWDDLFYQTPVAYTPTYQDYVAPTFEYFYDPSATETDEWNYDGILYTPIPQQTPTLTEAPTPTPTVETPTPAVETPTQAETTTPTETLTETNTPTINQFYFYTAYIPDNWNQNIDSLGINGTIVSGKRCVDDGGGQVNISPSWASGSGSDFYVRDCFRGIGDQGTRFESLLFKIPISEPTPTPLVEHCDFYDISIHDFWSGTISGMVNAGSFIGGYRDFGNFEYNDGISASSSLIKFGMNNTSHPNFGVGEQYNSIRYHSCQEVELVDSAVFDIHEVLIPSSNSKTIQQLIVDEIGWSPGTCLDIIGYFDCNALKRFNEVNASATPTSTLEARNYKASEVLSNCSEEGFTTNRVLDRLYIRKMNCGASTIEEGIY